MDKKNIDLISRKKIKGFDGIRGLAVISVVLTHLGVYGSLENAGILPPSIIPLLHGSTGVQVFFVLSGFLITTLLINEYNSYGRISLKNFMIRRTLRIFPVYLVFLISSTIIHLIWNNTTTWESLTYAYLYAYNFISTDHYTPFIGHTWSLAVEEHFYLVWPIIFLLTFRSKHQIILIILALSIVASIAMHYLLIKNGYEEQYFVSRWSFIAGYNISFGCIAALIINHGKHAYLLQRAFRLSVIFITGILLFSHSALITSGYWFIDEVVSGYFRSIGIVLIISWVYLNSNSWIVRVLEVRPLVYIGVISYGVYMYQGLFLATGPFREQGQNWPPSQSYGVIWLLIAAPLSYHYFERPILKLKKKLCENFGS